jgi:hypothetical protein
MWWLWLKYMCVTELGRRWRKREREKKIVFRMLLMLPFSFSYPPITFRIFVYIYDQNFKINATFANCNGIVLMNNMQTKKKKVQVWQSLSERHISSMNNVLLVLCKSISTHPWCIYSCWTMSVTRRCQRITNTSVWFNTV